MLQPLRPLLDWQHRLVTHLLSTWENTLSYLPIGAKHRGQRKYGTSKRPSITQSATKPAAPPKRELQKSTPKTAKEFIDTRWPKVVNFYSLTFKYLECLQHLQNMFDNMSGFWRMQCAEDEFKITPKNYSLYLDPKQREKELKITWVNSVTNA